MLFYSLLFTVSCAALATDTHALSVRQAAAVEDTFNIYAYGEGISGLSLFYADGKYSAKAQIGDAALSTAKTAQPVYFTISETSPNSWMAHPNNTGIDSTEAAIQTTVLSLPDAGSENGAVAFKQPTTTQLQSQEASVFEFYGDYVMINKNNTYFYAVPTDADGVYSLIWSDVASEHIPVILRTVAPATESMF